MSAPKAQAPFEEGFMLSLVVLALLSLIWLFVDFIPALFFALLLCVATFSFYQKLENRFTSVKAALLMTLAISTIVVFPISYLLVVGSLQVAQLSHVLEHDFDAQNIQAFVTALIDSLPLSSGIKQNIFEGLDQYMLSFFSSVQQFLLLVLQSVVTFSSQFVFFIGISLFALFYFYQDGASLVKRVVHLSPLPNRLDRMILQQFSALSMTLVGSVFLIAVLQGVLFSLAVAWVGLPWFYFGVFIALASFIPVVGGLLVWLPLGVYLWVQGEVWQALFIVSWGALVIGVLVDNIVRPMVLKMFAKFVGSGENIALNHTLITVLSTLAGVMQFGILGLFLGPIVAALAITVFDVYALKYQRRLDDGT